MRNMAVLHSPAFSYPLPVLVRVLFNLLIFKGKILYYNKYYKNDKADTPNTLQPVNGMNDFLFASRFYKIAADSSYFRKNTRKH